MSETKKSDVAPAVAGKGTAAKGTDDEGETKDGKLGWIVGWIVIPGLVIGGIFGSGVHLGASYPDRWYTEFVVWVAGLFG